MGKAVPGWGSVAVYRAALAALVVATGAALVPRTEPAPAREPAASSLGDSGCSERSWVGGTTEWCDGALVYRDYVYDDAGADTRPGSMHGTVLNRAVGDVDHTAHRQSLNSADLLTLTLTRRAGNIDAAFELNTLQAGDATVAALAIDLDDNTSTGGGSWGHGVNIASAGHDLVAVFDDRDAATNTIAGSVAIPAGTAADATWRVQAVLALGDGTVMNVAYRGTNETGNWWEAAQAAALTAGDVSAFGARVALADFGDGVAGGAAGRHQPAAMTSGFFERVYRSGYTVPRAPGETSGEGVDYDGVPGRAEGAAFGQEYAYLGATQPYGIYIPPADSASAGDDYGVQFVLHGQDANHASLVNLPGMQARFGRALDRILLVPLGRGPKGAYADYSERDVLDVLADVESTYPVDTDRVFMGGYSMGGGGAYRLAVLYPDRFAGVTDWVGHTGDCFNPLPIAQGDGRGQTPLGPLPADTSGQFSNDPSDRGGCPASAIGNYADYFANLRYLPTAMVYAAADELVWVNQAVTARQRFAELGYEHIHWTYAAEHLTFALRDDWAKEAAWSAGRTRPSTVSRVSFTTNPWMWNPALGLRADRAWWVRDLAPRELGKSVNWAAGTRDLGVDLTSHACPTDAYDVELRTTAGADPLAWVAQEGVPTTRPSTTPANRISGTIVNVAEATIDLDRACIDPDAPLQLDVVSDGPAVLHLVGPSGVRDVALSGP